MNTTILNDYSDIVFTGCWECISRRLFGGSNFNISTPEQLP